MLSKKQEGRKDLVFGIAVELKQQCLLFFKQGMIYFEFWEFGQAMSMPGNFGQTMSVPAVPLLTSSPCIMCVQYIEGYHEYIGGIS